MVPFVTMKRAYIKWRRGRVIDKAIANGERLNDLKIVRAGINGAAWPDVAREVELDIEAAERRAEKYRNYIRNTEAL